MKRLTLSNVWWLRAWCGGLLLALTACAAAQPAESERQVLEALKARRYADAIVATRRSAPSAVERNFAVGVLVLEGLSDTQAVQRPHESVSEGLSLIEASALQGHAQAIATLATTFSQGVGAMPGYSQLIEPDARLGECWEEARRQPARASECVAMRAAK